MAVTLTHGPGRESRVRFNPYSLETSVGRGGDVKLDLTGSTFNSTQADIAKTFRQYFCVSRDHFSLSPKDGRIMLRDRGSRNGTKVNGIRVNDAGTVLNDGDNISAGGYEMTFGTDGNIEYGANYQEPVTIWTRVRDFGQDVCEFGKDAYRLATSG